MLETSNYIVDSNGQVGLITERRDNCIFARPIDMPYLVDCGIVDGAKLITTTPWHMVDGELVGCWVGQSAKVSAVAYAGTDDLK